MPTHKGFVATIFDTKTNIPLTEYAPSINPATNTATSYIETTANQTFTIVLRDTSQTVSQGTAVYVDGVYIDNGLTGPGIASERRWFGKRIDHDRVRPFIFRQNQTSSPTIADDDRIGTISLTLRRCHIGGLADDQTNRGCVPADMEPPNIRHLNSQEDYLAHRAEYEFPTSIPATLYHVNWIDPQDGPAYIEFKFFYRSKEVLISKGIIPGRKRKSNTKSDTKKKSTTKKTDDPESSATTVAASSSPPSTRSRAPPAKKAKIVKPTIKKEVPSKEQSPIESDPPTSPLVEAVQRRQMTSHPNDLLPWVYSQSANIDLPVEVFRELQHLRNEVKRLQSAQNTGPQVPAENPYIALAGYSSLQNHLGRNDDGFRENWDANKPGDVSPSGENTEGAPE